MATYRFTAANGKKYKFEGPEGASQEELEQHIADMARQNPSLGIEAPGYKDFAGNTYAADFGTQRTQDQKETGSDFTKGIAGGVDSIQATLYGLAGLAGDSVGLTGLRNWGFEGYQRNMDEVNSKFSERYSLDDWKKTDLIDATQYWLGYAVPNLAGGGLAGIVGKQIAKQGIKQGVKELAEEGVKKAAAGQVLSAAEREAVGQVAKTGARGATAGIMGSAIGQELGATYGQAADENGIDNVDLGKVYAYGTAAGLLEGATDVLTLGLGKIGPAKDLMSSIGKGGRVTSALARGATGAVTEGVTEGIQTGLEDMGAGKTAAEARFFDPTSMFAGAVGGGGVGIVSGALSPGNQSKTASDRVNASADVISTEGADLAAQQAQEDAALQQQAEAEAQAQQQAEAQRVDAAKNLRLKHAETFPNEEDFYKQREASRAADLDNPASETGAAYNQWRKDNDIYDNTDKVKKQFLRDWVTSDDKSVAKGEYLTALDAHAAFKEEQAARTPEVAAPIEAKKAELIAKRNAATAAKDAAAVQEIDNEAANTFTNPAEWADALWTNQQAQTAKTKGLAANAKKTPAASATNAATAAVDANPTNTAATVDATAAVEAVTDAAAPAATQKAPSKKDLAKAAAAERLGENWEAEYPELSQSIESGGLYAKKKGGQSKFDKLLSEAVAEKNKATDTAVDAVSTAETTANTPMVDTTNQSESAVAMQDATKDLSPNQKKVFDLMYSAAQNNELDTYIQADGKVNYDKIAEDAGLQSKNPALRRQTAKAAWEQIKPKMAKAMGASSVQQVKQTLAANKQVTGEGINDDPSPAAQESIVDEAEIFGENASMGLLDSVSGSQKFVEMGALNQEEKDYTNNVLANRPDPVAERRKAEAEARLEKDMETILSTVDAKTAIELWNKHKSDGVVTADKIESKRAGYSWLLAVQDYLNHGNEKLLIQDQRELEQMYDMLDPNIAQEIGNETNTGGQTESQAGTQEGRPLLGTGTEGRSQTDEGGAADTGAVQQADATPELTTADQFKERAAGVKVQTKKRRSAPKMGVSDQADNPYTAEELRDELSDFIRADIPESKLLVVDSVADLLSHPDPVIQRFGAAIVAQQIMGNNAYGVADNGQAVLIADRIEQGEGRAKFLHEVGSHLGLDNLLPKATYDRLINQLKDWVNSDADTDEVTIAARAQLRLENSGTTEENLDAELLAYFIEEASLAGIDPTAVSKNSGPLQQWFRSLVSSFKRALRKLGLKPQTLTVQDIVNMAYGAAQLEVSTADGNTTSKFGINPKKTAAGTLSKASTKVRDRIRNQFGDKAAQFYTDGAFIAQNAVDSLKFLHQFIDDVKTKMPSAKKWYEAVKAAEKTRTDIRQQVESIATRARDLAPERFALVNKFIGDSTFYQKWGYTPSWKASDANFKVDPVMKVKFDRLTADEKQLVQDIFAHGETMKNRKRDIAKKMGVEGKFFTGASLDGPYAPLKRFGNFAAVLKSQTLLDAEAAYKAKPNKINEKKLDDLKADENHYIVSFFDTMGSAQAFVDANQNDYAFSEASARDEQMDNDRAPNYKVFEKVLGALNAGAGSGLGREAQTAFTKMIKDMYFQSLDESNARLSGARRKRRAGYDQNMIRSFLHHATAEAALIANMEHGADINTAFVEAGKEAAANRTELQDTYNVISQHYKDVYTPSETPWQDRIAAANTVWMLTTSIGYHVTNATQPIMVSIPKLAGDFGNYKAAWDKLLAGYAVALKIVKPQVELDKNAKYFGFKKWQVDIDIKNADPKYQKMLQELQLRELLDVGMEQDLSEFNRFDTGYRIINKGSEVMSKVVHRLYQVARTVEAYNRVSSAVAAYDLAKANPGKLQRMGMTAEEYAVSVVENTQGNFSRTDAPLLLKKLPKVTGQYRKYQLLMGWAYAKAFDQARTGDTAEERAVGKRTLAYLMGHAGLFAGATGVPILTTMANIFLWATGDGDEPQDLERWIRTNVEDKTMADVLSRGVFSLIGVDMSAKLSQAKIFDPIPYTNIDLTEKGMSSMVFDAVMGPTGSNLRNMARAKDFFGQGDLYRGIETAMPKGIKTAMESYRIGTEGYKMKNGDVVADPSEFGTLGLLANAIGLPSSDLNRIKWTRGQQYELEQWFTQRSSEIRAKYIRAYNADDTAEMDKLADEFRDLQDAKDRVRPFFNDSRKALKRQSIFELRKSPRAQRTREMNMRRQLGTDD